MKEVANDRRLILLVGILVLALSTRTTVASESEEWWHKVDNRISLCERELLFGVPTYLEIILINHYSETVYVWDQLDNVVELSAEDNLGRSIPQSSVTLGLFRSVSIRPCDSLTRTVCLNEQLSFPGPGIYKVTCRGNIPVGKRSYRESNMDWRTLSIAGIITVKLRGGSTNELETALGELLIQMENGDQNVAKRAAQALAVSQPVLTVKLLNKTIQNDHGEQFVAHAMWVLGKLGNDEATQALLDATIKSCKQTVRTSAIATLGEWHIARGVPVLLEALSDPTAEIRLAALRAILVIREKTCASQVQLRFADSDERVRKTAKEVYEGLTRSDDEKRKAVAEAVKLRKDRPAPNNLNQK